MNILNNREIVSAAVAHQKKPAVYVCNQLWKDMQHRTTDEIAEDDVIFDLVSDRLLTMFGGDKTSFYGYIAAIASDSLFLFDTDKEANDFFQVFMQDRVYSSAIYAALFDAAGECTDENT